MQEPKTRGIATLSVVKRDGRHVEFDLAKIERAIERAAKSTTAALTPDDQHDID